MADKNKLKKISAELKKASKMHAAQAEKIENMSKGPSMINIAGAVAGLNNQKKSTAVGSVSPHSHDSSKDNAQPIPPITPPMPDNITGNIGNNFKVQELGKSMFQGEEMANQFAQRQMDKPVMPPSPDPVGDELGNMFMQPFSRKKTKQERVNPTKKAKQGLHSSGRYPSKINMNGDPIKSQEVPQQPPQEKNKKTTFEFGGGGLQRVTKRRPEQKMVKPRQMPRQIIQRVNMNGDPKYNFVGVQGLEDKGKVKYDKKGPYVVNKKQFQTGTSRDTLRLPKNVWKNPSSGLIDDGEYREIANKVNKN